VTGGQASFCVTGSDTYAELYDPTTGTFAMNAPLPSGAGVPATLLPDGRVLIQGLAGGAWLYDFVAMPAVTVVMNGGVADITAVPADIRQPCFPENPLFLVYMPGTTVILTASDMNSEGNYFVGWSGCDGVQGTQCTVTVTASRSISVSYGLLTTVTVTTDPSGPGIEVDGIPYPTTPVFFFWPEGSIHTIGAPSPQLYQNGETFGEYLFNAWSDGGGQWHEVLTTSSPALTAFFSLRLQPARIGGFTFPTIFDAYRSAYDGAIIEAQATTFTGNLTLEGGTSVSVIGGFDAVYSASPVGMTTIEGNVTVAKGRLIVDRLVVR
jgi:hypothetical protein